MAEHDDLLKALRSEAREALDRVEDGLGQAWPPDRQKRAITVLSYVALSLERTDAELVAPSVVNDLRQRFAQTANEPGTIADERFDPWLDALIGAVSRLPVGGSREFEQEAKDAAKAFQRSSRSRLAVLEKEIASVREEVQVTSGRLEQLDSDAREARDQRLNELKTSIDELSNSFEQRIQSYESTLETEREASLKQRNDQATTFEAAQSERAETAEQRVSKLEADLQKRADEAIEGLERSRQEVSALVELVTRSTTSEGFAGEAREQKTVADLWRRFAVALGLAAGERCDLCGC